MIAQSLSCDPKLLIADEPTTALDVTVQAEILDLMRNLRNKLDSAIVLITHDMGVVADLADRIAVMRRGLIVETGTAEQVFRNPRHEYTQALQAAVPHLGQGGAAHGAEVDVTAALAAATHAELESADRQDLVRRERERLRQYHLRLCPAHADTRQLVQHRTQRLTLVHLAGAAQYRARFCELRVGASLFETRTPRPSCHMSAYSDQ
jgi:ABC-type dipeptide/oligopeptide/nickel transport system ATPase component